MILFLDTNICIYALKGQFPQIQTKMQTFLPDLIRIPAMVKAELLLGTRKSSNPRKALPFVEQFLAPYEIVPFDDRAATAFSMVRCDLEKAGKTIGPYDLIIAATVLANDGVLVTRNTREFSRVPGLNTLDWTRD